MALEASDRLNESIGGVPVDVFHGLPSNSVRLCLTSWGKSKEISQDLRRTIVDLHKSGSSLGAISKHLNPRTTAKDLVKMLEETGTKVSKSTVKQVL